MIVVFHPSRGRGGGGWGHHLPLLFSGLAQLPLVDALKISHRGCGVEATATITRARDVHEWGSTGEWWEGGDGVVWSDFIASAMVVRVFWRVEKRICCRVYVVYGKNVSKLRLSVEANC